ncbi:MAG: hypothetical protein CEE38_15365 [Planctomycetes bacterium B3_Pla]|nr:MAG: hypothetical protein CEE38_15365 [Planctomycetes bacterium B3_Pla]
MYRDRNSKGKSKIGMKLYLWSLVPILMAAIAVADAGTGGGGADTKPIQSFKFEEEFSVRRALQMLGNAYQKNIVPTQSVDGALAFRGLTDVSFEEAMDAILGGNFKYEQTGNLIKVYTNAEYQTIMENPDRKEHKIFTLYYTTAEEAKKLIVPVLSSDAVVETTTPAETGVAEVSGGGGGGTTATASLGGDSLALNDMIIVYDYPEKIKLAAEVIRSIDVRPKQVLVEATILSAILDEGMELGVNLNFMDGIALTGYPAINLDIGAPIETTGFSFLTDGLRVGVQSGNTMAFINALEAVTDTTVLANPKILAVNKQEGSVLIGNKLGYRSSTTISSGGIATEGEVKFLDTGTFLSFRPYIGNDGYIRMDIHPKDSSGALNADGVPNENVTQCLSNIMVKDGETVVIGGLFRDVIVAARSQVPLLGDIPIVGALFRGTFDSSQREEVIILLTVHIINEPADVEGVERANDVRRKRFGAKDGLQWLGRPRLAGDYYTKAVNSYIEGDFETSMRQLRFSLDRRPTYLEAIRLKERIISEASPADVEKLERIMLENIDEEEAPKWNRK